ncbi:MAG: DUF2905 domain-containing protein [Gammaproteobacteria bacterium]|jgi:hypothetical protein
MTAKLLIGIGAGLIAIGLTLRYAPWLLSWFGNLPGDIDIRRENSRVFVPITSMIVISVVASIIINIFFRR